MKIDKEQYEQIYQSHVGKSNLLKDCAFAFLIGGGICLFGEILTTFYLSMGIEKEQVVSYVPITLVFLGVLLTALRQYHKIANIAGAGTMVPITGFANAVSSAALEFKSEGIIFGTCVKMFSIAGPVIVCGTSASIVYGFIILLMR